MGTCTPVFLYLFATCKTLLPTSNAATAHCTLTLTIDLNNLPPPPPPPLPLPPPPLVDSVASRSTTLRVTFLRPHLSDRLFLVVNNTS